MLTWMSQYKTFIFLGKVPNQEDNLCTSVEDTDYYCFHITSNAHTPGENVKIPVLG